MKMKLYHRLILVVGALITLLIGVVLIVTACGLLQKFTLIPQAEGESFFSWKRITVIVAGAFLVLFGGYTMLFPGKTNEASAEAIKSIDLNGIRKEDK